MVIGIFAIILSVVLFCAFFGGAGVIALILAVIMLVVGISLLAKNFTLGFDSNLEKTVAQFGCIHLSGLPLGEVGCQVTAYENRLVFKKDKSTYELSYDKITAVDLREKSQLAGASAGSVVAAGLSLVCAGVVISSAGRLSLHAARETVPASISSTSRRLSNLVPFMVTSEKRMISDPCFHCKDTAQESQSQKYSFSYDLC